MDYCRFTYIVLDISGRNITFTCSYLWKQTEEQLFNVLGLPEIEPLTRVDDAPLAEGLPTQLDDEDIKIFDFAESFFQGQESAKLAQPGSLRIPETIFTDKLDYRVDLWRTGCMVCQRILPLKQKS
ncbi:hypothetical protein N7468_007960 [Penicillium chermesinum]|uniref:Uncharacterized protein n=1 Tax=Penicillium chermesinum TaxID=63820 RepID=A0A9W9NR72_9EURO|nr:uncharacterized protein N7468_007960 [Penicillium chermesinum]KAJ5223418.1 hypothetical protein N7468_007960 [Penicillium chermesinum]KAJ6155746.1 hypothetical protein N7470_006312 [Penicillium chermesinum]